MLVEQDPEDADGPDDVLDVLFAEILERDIETVAHLISHGGGNADPVRGSHLLEARCHIDAIAKDVAVLDNDVADIDADPELDPAVQRHGGIAFGHSHLHFGGAS